MRFSCAVSASIVAACARRPPDFDPIVFENGIALHPVIVSSADPDTATRAHMFASDMSARLAKPLPDASTSSRRASI